MSLASYTGAVGRGRLAPVPGETATSHVGLSGMAKLLSDSAVEEAAKALNDKLRTYDRNGKPPGTALSQAAAEILLLSRRPRRICPGCWIPPGRK